MSHPPRKIAIAFGPALPDGPLDPCHAGGPIPQMPLIDIHDTPDGLVLEADLPGATDEAVNILLEANVLSLKVEVLPDIEPGARLLHQEYPVPGVFQRSFILSDEVDRSRISAELRNGVLRLHLPKAERTAARRIEVKNQ